MDEHDLEQFLREVYPGLVERMAGVSGGRANAEDDVQEALVRAWQWDRMRPLVSVPAWVTTVALNLARDRHRRQRTHERRVPAPGGLDSPTPLMQGPSVEETAVLVDVRRALDRLPARQLQVVVLRYYFGMSLKDIARQLGVSDGTVKTSMSRARRTLAAVLLVESDEGS